ncbi:hypothetical protein J132_10436 [Termitomyces sp. J132]|nr:hypothetical protein H2248_006738 [Termitomyces sp. 'cryptogamus']KAH0588002.1 hypothetical protein H2248_006742 [Termitomyces sp. 'cryptogamus']KNZ76461.1 hypothetical protein J132_10436 [Termitomyces sp. J132]
MKFSALSLGLCAFATASVKAQYFSAGWTPGQPEPTPANNGIPQELGHKVAPQGSATSISNLFDITTLLSSSLSVSLFSKLGINITERLESALEKTKVWDKRVSLITDDNYHDLIVNEPLTPQEEQDRTWIIVISVTSGRQDGMSLFVDTIFDEAFNETVVAGDLPNVRWGRIDYLNVTSVTTKWCVWHAPYLVVLKDRGRTLRFYRPGNLRLRADALRSFLQNEEWMLTTPWSSVWAPGGDREWILDYLALIMTKIYNVVILFPRWLLFIISGSIASVVINFLHKPPPTPAASTQRQNQTTPAAVTSVQPSADAIANSTANSSSTNPTKRKKVKGKN